MTTADFSRAAAQLQDDPDQPISPSCNSTTFPGLENDINGEIRQMDDEDAPNSGLQSPAVNEEDATAAQSARPMAGLDVLAFYKSFRFTTRSPFAGRWGIFLLDAGVEGLARDLRACKLALPHFEARKLAREILLAHERYHFWIDVWALGQEITPLRDLKLKRYEYYLAGKQGVELTSYDLEESLANHYAFNKLRRGAFTDGSMVAPVLRQVLLDGPSPYSDFIFGAEDRAKMEGGLALAVANGRNFRNALLAFSNFGNDADDSSVLGASIQPVDRRHPVVGYSKCPTHFVQTQGYAGLVQPFQGPSLKEFRLFLTNYLRGEKEKATDHNYYRIDNGQRVKFPNPHDKEVRGYELKGTLIKAGMTKKEFDIARDETDRWARKCPRFESKQPLTAT